MNRLKTAFLAATIASSGLAGGIIGAGVMGAHAATVSVAPVAATTAATATPPAGAGTGTFTPNENATHEAGESAAREAQENSGQMPTVP